MKKLLVALFSIYLIWGSTYLGIRYALESFPPLALSGTRFLSAGLLLYWISRAYHDPQTRLRHWISAAVVGFFLLVAGNGLVCWAEQWVSSGQAALLASTTPLWMVLWSARTQGYPGHATVAGVVLSTLGMLVLLGGPGHWSWASLGVLAASLSWTAGSLIARSTAKPSSGTQFSAMTMIAAGAMLLLFSLISGEKSPGPVTVSALLAWTYLTLAGSLVAMTAYQWLLTHASPTLVATHTYVNPLVAVALSWLAGESLPAGIPVALMLVSGGIALIGLRRVSLPFPSARIFRMHMPLVGHASF